MKKDYLQKYNGKEGEKSFVSYKGKVYDVSESRLWKNGKHVNKHEAGMDLSEAMESAPHGAEVLERFEHVDTLEGFKIQKKTGRKETLKKLYRMFHPHPMLIHFPMGLLGFTVIMQFIYLITRDQSFEVSSFYSLVVAVIFTVPTIFSGILSWWLNYDFTVNKIFMYKLWFSIMLFIMGVIELSMRFSDPSVSAHSFIYNIMIFANIPVLAVVGFNGGKLSWG